MAVNGLFTYEDLYAGKSENYRHRFDLQGSSSFISHQIFSEWDRSLPSSKIIPPTDFEKIVLSTENKLEYY